jgi:hypothetical protein
MTIAGITIVSVVLSISILTAFIKLDKLIKKGA